MNPNPFLKKLGFSPSDRVAIVHADDVGMCQATLPAIADLLDFGLVTSAAVMVPCPWFPGAAQYAREHPDADFGVHLTLNSEWDNYSWGPVSTREPSSGLVDDAGHFFSQTEITQARADTGAVRRELDAQLAIAKAAGISPTHADTHMFCLGHARFFPHYVQAARDAGTLPLVLAPGSPGWEYLFGGPAGDAGPVESEAPDSNETAPTPDPQTSFDFSGDAGNDEIESAVRQLVEQGVPAIDDVYMMNLDTPEDRLEEAKQAFAGLEPGFTHFILHPALETPELRAMAPDWRCRVADFETFMSRELKDYVKAIGVQLIGYGEFSKA